MFSAGTLKKISLYYIILYPIWSTEALIIRNKVNIVLKHRFRFGQSTVYSDNYVTILHCKYNSTVLILMECNKFYVKFIIHFLIQTLQRRT